MLIETIILAQREIRRNVLKSALTILGIVIGVAAVIMLVTIGNGVTAEVAGQIGALGSNVLDIRPGQDSRGPGGGATIAASNFKLADVEAIKEQVSKLAAVAPIATTSGQVIFSNENRSTNFIGSDNAYFKVRGWGVEKGRTFSDGELRTGHAVCLLGAAARKALFGGQRAIGKSVRLGNVSFQVIGLLESKGQSVFGENLDDLVVIPIVALQRRIAGNTDVNSITVLVRNKSGLNKVKKIIATLMRERRRIDPGDKDDFTVDDMREIMNVVTGATKILTALLSAVAAVSLLVGGIGIMNIMLVSVTERTREIGIRLAIGALGREVMMQFLVESVVLSCFGGMMGIALGLASAGLAAIIMNIPFVFQVEIIIIALVFSSAVGIVFGYFPARKAAQLDPIEALRHE